jgi:predicted DNA-binding transcriptional regulator YafY
MPINKSALVRYQALDRCFSDPHRKYYIHDLIDACQEALYKLYDKKETVSRRSVYYDMEFMASAEGYQAPIERIPDGRKIYYRYADPTFTINRQPLNEQETTQLKEAFGLLSRLSGRHEFALINDLLPKIEQFLDLEPESPIISYDENKDLKNHHLQGEVFNAIRDHRVLDISYQSFKSDYAESYILHPYFLKQYNTRWFVFGHCPELAAKYQSDPVNFALDRIEQIRYADIPYMPNATTDFESYFDDIIGVSKPSNDSPQKVTIKVTPDKKPYIETKPLHMTQKRLKPHDDSFITSIEVIPNYEMYSLFLSLGPDVEVVEPEEVRNHLKALIDNMHRKY